MLPTAKSEITRGKEGMLLWLVLIMIILYMISTGLRLKAWQRSETLNSHHYCYLTPSMSSLTSMSWCQTWTSNGGWPLKGNHFVLWRKEDDNRIRHIPVIDDKGTKGMVSVEDVVHAVVSEHRDEFDRSNTFIQGGY